MPGRRLAGRPRRGCSPRRRSSPPASPDAAAEQLLDVGGCGTMSMFIVSSPVSTTIVPIFRIRWENDYRMSTRSSCVYGIMAVFLLRIPSSRIILLSVMM